MRITLEINGKMITSEANPTEKLLDFLRKLGYKSVKAGCREGDCGACTVLFNGNPIRSCLMFALQADGAKIETLEGITPEEGLHPIQKAFLDEGAVQCGFCTPGMVLTTKALLEKNETPTEEDIREALKGNLCRCTVYVQQINAVKKVVNKV
jgi:aerobic-type carbon monoxide dehydrogenase small subunit (CoxS/CutS family)